MARVLPTDEELLTEIETHASGGVGEPKNRRIVALEKLQRARFTNPNRAVNVLCELIHRVGPQPPDFHLVITCLTRILNSREEALAPLIALCGDHHGGAIQCGCRVLPCLSAKAQVPLARSLALELLARDTRDHVAEGLRTALKDLKNPQVKRTVTQELAVALDSPDPLTIDHVVSVLAQIADESIERSFVRVLRKLLRGYYPIQTQGLREDLCAYFAKTKSKAAVPTLVQAMEAYHDDCFAKTMGAICERHPEMQGKLLRLFREANRKPTGDAIKLSCLRALSAIGKPRPRVAELATMVSDRDLEYPSFRAEFRSVLLKNPRESKPMVLQLLAARGEMQYQFALEVLKEMQIPIAEAAKAVGVNPLTAAYNYFFEGGRDGLGLRPIWEAKSKLGDKVRGQTRFEHLVRHLLSCLGFITLDVDASGKAGVDTVALPPKWSHLLVIGTTTGVVEQDLVKLANTTMGLTSALGKLAQKIDILPLVVTSLAAETDPKYVEYARRHGILILRASDVDRLFEWVCTNRTYKDVLTYLDRKAGRGRPRSVVEALLDSVGSAKA